MVQKPQHATSRTRCAVAVEGAHATKAPQQLLLHLSVCCRGLTGHMACSQVPSSPTYRTAGGRTLAAYREGDLRITKACGSTICWVVKVVANCVDPGSVYACVAGVCSSCCGAALCLAFRRAAYPFRWCVVGVMLPQVAVKVFMLWQQLQPRTGHCCIPHCRSGRPLGLFARVVGWS